jgi:hypothetical protein
MSTTSTTGAFERRRRPGRAAPADEAVHRRDDDGVASVMRSSSSRAATARTARAPGRAARRRLVPRLGVVERLLGQQLPLEQAARAVEVGLRELQVGLALPDGGLAHLVGGLGLLHLLADLAVLDPAMSWPRHGIAEPDLDRLEPAADLRRHLDRLARPDEVADDQVGLRGARADRIVELEPDVPGRRFERPDVPQGVDVARRRDGLSSSPVIGSGSAGRRRRDPSGRAAVTRFSAGMIWFWRLRSVMSADSRFIRVTARSVRWLSAVRTAASRSSGCSATWGGPPDDRRAP